MDKEIKKLEKDLKKITQKINLFLKLMQNGIESAKEAKKDEVPLIFVNEDKKEFILYDIDKDKVYNAPIDQLFNLQSNVNDKSYILDITSLISEYVKISIELLEKIDKIKE